MQGALADLLMGLSSHMSSSVTAMLLPTLLNTWSAQERVMKMMLMMIAVTILRCCAGVRVEFKARACKQTRIVRQLPLPNFSR